MATHTSTAPARAGERARSPKSQIGPVTAAIRTMRKAERIDDAVQALAALRQCDPEIDSIPALRDLRTALADRIEADIALLDALCGDADIEQDAGEMPESETFNRNLDDEPSLGSLYGTAEGAHLGQGGWADGGAYDLEEAADDLPQWDPADSGIGDYDGLIEQMNRDTLRAL
jgi:hypothetical protein